MNHCYKDYQYSQKFDMKILFEPFWFDKKFNRLMQQLLTTRASIEDRVLDGSTQPG